MNVLPLGDMPVLAVIATDLSAEQEIRDIRAQVAEQNALIDRKNEELKAQEAVRQTSERAAAEARRVLEGIPQIAWTANAQGQITYLNSRWFDYTGQTPGLLPLPVQWQAHLHPDDAAAVVARWAQCLASGEAFDVEYRFRDRSGNYRWMLGRALPSRSEQGDVLQWIGTSTDIHEHKLALGRIAQAQRQLRHNNEQLTRANVDLDNFIYTASHDLKAPITNIEGLLQALEIELPAESHAEAEVPAILGMMHDSVTRFKKTIEQLTDVSKLQKEQGQPVETASLAAVVRDVCLDLGPQIEGSGAVMDVDVSQCPEVRISGKNLRSVVYNLLSNALKYHHPDRPPHVRVRCHSAPLHDVLTVQDNGLGLSMANQQQLFGMFQRFHDHVEGSGIGLYMVKKMVTNAGGRIAVQSEEGQGTTFSVYFARS
jgi:PAS domain S-box-containing protein